jgi:alpha-galactosidase
MRNAEHSEYAGPGRWNDPDYILIGVIGNAHRIDEAPKPTNLTPDEQYSYMSMWSLMASPLFFSGDMGRLDEFTLNVLCNAEVIDVNQDALGKQARIVRRTDEEFVLAKPLEDGSVAVGLFNIGETPRKLTVKWTELNLSGRKKTRDLWRQKDIGVSADSFVAEVPRHGVAMVRLSAAK